MYVKVFSITDLDFCARAKYRQLGFFVQGQRKLTFLCLGRVKLSFLHLGRRTLAFFRGIAVGWVFFALLGEAQESGSRIRLKLWHRLLDIEI